MRAFAISVVGRDRPGIVAAISGVLLEHRVNIEDSRMTILRGHLAMTLVIAIPDEVDAGVLGRDLDGVRTDLGLESLSLAEVAELEPDASAEPSYIVSVYGVDHPGIVHAVASAMAEREVDITDLNTRLVGEGEAEPLYALMMEVALPESVSAEDLEESLAGVGHEHGLEVTLRELDQDAL